MKSVHPTHAKHIIGACHWIVGPLARLTVLYSLPSLCVKRRSPPTQNQSDVQKVPLLVPTWAQLRLTWPPSKAANLNSKACKPLAINDTWPSYFSIEVRASGPVDHVDGQLAGRGRDAQVLWSWKWQIEGGWKGFLVLYKLQWVKYLLGYAPTCKLRWLWTFRICLNFPNFSEFSGLAFRIFPDERMNFCDGCGEQMPLWKCSNNSAFLFYNCAGRRRSWWLVSQLLRHSHTDSLSRLCNVL